MSDKDRNDQDILRIPLVEEHLEATVRDRQEGVVRFTKRVEVDPVAIDLDVRSDDIFVERIPRNQETDTALKPWYDGDTLVVPVYEERLVVEKRLVLVEEIRVRQQVKTEQVTVEDTVRREVVDIETQRLPDQS